MSNYIQTLDTHERLYDGAIINLARFPGIKWILHNGWYTYNDKAEHGWYFSSIPSQTIIPVANQDLYSVYIISDGASSTSYDTPAGKDCHCDDHRPPRPPRPPRPGCPPGPNPFGPHYPDPFGPPPFDDDIPVPVSLKWKKLLDSAFVSVATVQDRDAIDTETIPDGKIFRVNYISGTEGPKYFIWDAQAKTWKDWDIVFKSNVEDYVQQAAEEFKNQISDNQKSIIKIFDDLEDASADRQKIKDSISELKTSIDAINSTIDGYQKQLDLLRDTVSDNKKVSDDTFSDVDRRLKPFESILNRLSEKGRVLVSGDHDIVDSGVVIGKDEIKELTEYTSNLILATEKAVAKRVDDNITCWKKF